MQSPCGNEGKLIMNIDSPHSKNLILDIGANEGLFSLEIAQLNLDHTILAFEPEPTLSQQLKMKAENSGIKNHKVIEKAISETNGNADFYVSNLGDWGTSSLYTFCQDHVSHDEYWSLRTDLKHTRKITVETIRLDTFLNEVNYDSISFIKIDAQGADLKVLLSMGNHIKNVKAGMLEVVGVKEKALYADESDDLKMALNFLNENKLQVYSIKPNDHAANEFNIFFRRPDVDIAELESRLSLKQLKMYSGKDFWHFPADRWIDYDNILHNLQNSKSAHEELVIRHEALTEAHNTLIEINNTLTSELAQLKESYAKIRNNLAIKILIQLRRLFKRISL